MIYSLSLLIICSLSILAVCLSVYYIKYYRCIYNWIKKNKLNKKEERDYTNIMNTITRKKIQIPKTIKKKNYKEIIYAL